MKEGKSEKSLLLAKNAGMLPSGSQGMLSPRFFQKGLKNIFVFIANKGNQESHTEVKKQLNLI